MQSKNAYVNSASKSLKDLYLKTIKLSNQKKCLDAKIEVWKEFLSYNLRRLSVAEDEVNKKYFFLARKTLQELDSKRLRRNSKRRVYLLDYFFSEEKRLKRHCAMFNLQISYHNKNSYKKVIPFKVIDVDYDNVTFNLLFKTLDRSSNFHYAIVEIYAYDSNKVEIGRNRDFLLSIDHPKKVLKKIYVPNAAKDADKFLIKISFAKNDSN